MAPLKVNNYIHCDFNPKEEKAENRQGCCVFAYAYAFAHEYGLTVLLVLARHQKVDVFHAFVHAFVHAFEHAFVHAFEHVFEHAFEHAFVHELKKLKHSKMYSPLRMRF